MSPSAHSIRSPSGIQHCEHTICTKHLRTRHSTRSAIVRRGGVHHESPRQLPHWQTPRHAFRRLPVRNVRDGAAPPRAACVPALAPPRPPAHSPCAASPPTRLAHSLCPTRPALHPCRLALPTRSTQAHAPRARALHCILARSFSNPEISRQPFDLSRARPLVESFNTSLALRPAVDGYALCKRDVAM